MRQTDVRLSDAEHFIGLDVLKFICALLVAAIHLKPMAVFGDAVQFFILNTVCRLAVPLFFVISGFFLFDKLNDDVKMRKYLLRLLGFYLIYSAIYLPLRLQKLIGDPAEILIYIRKFFLYGSYVQLWYILSLLVSAVLIRFLYRRCRLKIQTILWITAALHIIGILISFYRPVWDHIPVVKRAIDGYFELFFDIENGIFWAFYTALGCRLKAGAENIRRRRYPLLAVLCFAAFTAEVYFGRDVLHTGNIQISFLLVPAVLFTFLSACFCRIPAAYRKPGVFLRKQSTLIYFWHMFFAFVFDVGYALLLHSGTEPNRMIKYLAVCTVNIVFAAVLIRLRDRRAFKFLNWLF